MTCPEYPKIDTLFERGEDFKVDIARLRRPEFEIPQRWLATEKVDGTNVCVSFERIGATHEEAGCTREGCEYGEKWVVRFYGRTANAQMPTFLLDHLQRTFTLEKMKSLWRGKLSCVICGGRGVMTITPLYDACSCFEPYPIVLYGEGYGAKIQKGGGNYRRNNDVSFRLFDVLIGDIWLARTSVEDVARQLNVPSVPKLGENWELGEIVEAVRGGVLSHVAYLEGVEGTKAEGVVAFTDPPLFNGRGQRLIWKLKTQDFTS